jgi:hypothetical protein
MNQDDDMKREYDFSKAERGKHYAGPDAVFHIPVYLQEDIQSFLLEKAQSKGTSGVTSKPAIEGHFKTGQREHHFQD